MDLSLINKLRIESPKIVTAAGDVVMGNSGVVVLKKTVGAATQVTLPGRATAGDFAYVIDGKGDASANAITVVPDGTTNNTTINGGANAVLSVNYGIATFFHTGSEWNTHGGLTNAIGASTAAAGTTTTDAGVLPAGTSLVYPTTGANDTAGVRINAADKVTGRQLTIGNGVSNKILKVYPPSGGTINGAAADAAFSSVSGKGVTIICLNAAANTWLAS